MPISCHMRDLGFSDSEAPAAKGPTPKPTHIGHFSSLAAHRKVRGHGGRGGMTSLRAGGGGTDGAERKGRGGGGLSERGGATSCASERAGARRKGRDDVPARRIMRAAALRAAARLKRWRD